MLVRPLTDQSFEIIAGAQTLPRRADGRSANGSGPHRQPHRRRGIGGAASRITCNAATFTLSRKRRDSRPCSTWKTRSTASSRSRQRWENRRRTVLPESA
ncbi:hypothetical protein [Edaphobacter aggregans]|uniref:hypothetical protein n=1 Tax=Edaphobacter aggregans TaxID=570835 RepID=UPI00316AE80A